MDWRGMTRLGTIGGALALSACMMPYDDGYGGYDAPPPAYSAIESPDLYAYIDRADSLWEAIGDAPPDHAFAFEGAEPWAWALADGHRIVVEETPDGIQSYYFAPGDAGPFLAVRPGMSFGFEGETVAVVYGPDGGALPRAEGAAHLDEGAELYARGRRLLRAMQPQAWRDVDSQAWIDTGPILWSGLSLWDEGRRRHPGWGHHRDSIRDGDWQRRLDAERARRAALSEQFRRWREGGFQGPPPGRFHRPGEGHGPGMGRPGRPGNPGAGRPGVDRPHQPGQGGRPPGAQPGRPPRPDGWVPGARPWRGGTRPGRPVPTPPPAAGAPDSPAVTPPAPGAGLPRRPGWGGRPRPERGDGERGGMGRPQAAPVVDGGRRPPPRRSEAAPSPAPAASAPPRSAPPPPAAAPRAAPPPAPTPRAQPRSSDSGVRERRVPLPDERF